MAIRVYNLYQAKSHFSRLVSRVANGEEIVIAKAGVPVARLVPIARSTQKRKPGGWKGKLRIARDFDAPSRPISSGASRGRDGTWLTCSSSRMTPRLGPMT